MSLVLTATATTDPPPSFLTGWVLTLTAELGAVGVGVLSFLEVVFPPIPSELVLPLAGYQVQVGELALASVFVAATLGSVLGSLVLYRVGAAIGLERAARIADRVPLLDPADVHAAARWFDRYDSVAVFTGRFVPGVRSVISLPAGAAGMPLWKFGFWTLLGSAIWNALLIGAGMALGTQYERVEEYAGLIDVAIYVLLGALVLYVVGRRVRRGRSTAVR